MKQSPVCYIALLAGILAICSAFISTKVYVDHFFVNFNRSIGFCDGKYIAETDSETEMPEIINVAQFDNWAAANCDGDTRVICAVHLQIDDQELLETLLITIKYGYQPSDDNKY